MLVFTVGVVGSYLFYVVFDSWAFERFLLPAAPLVYIAVAAVIVRGIEWLPRPTRTVACVASVALWFAHHVEVSQRLRVLETREAEQRYATIGSFLGCVLPARAVVFATVHSGSVRMYGHRLTVRWEALSPDSLDRTVAL